MLTDGAFGRPATLAERGEVAFAGGMRTESWTWFISRPIDAASALRFQDSANVAYYHQNAVRFSTEISELQLEAISTATSSPT
ncbi:MAG: hypothetical protein R3C28_10775 [Pirellulaceae bacterium]